MSAIVLAVALALVSEPTCLVERVVSAGETVQRTSVFRDGVLVVAVSRRGEMPDVRRRTLNEVELRVISQVVEECRDALAEGGYSFDEVHGDAVEFRLAPSGKPPLKVELGLAAVAPLPLARVGQALDELEKTLREGPAVRDDLSRWVPKVGDTVMMDDGRMMTVLEVLAGDEDLVVHLQIGDGPAAAYYLLRELRQRAVRRVGP